MMSDTEFLLFGLVIWFCLALGLPLLAYLVLSPFGYDVELLFEPTDLWVGAYYNRDAAIWYVCLIPTYGVKVQRDYTDPRWAERRDVLARKFLEQWNVGMEKSVPVPAPEFDRLLNQTIDLAFAFDRLVTASPAEYRLREHLDAEPQPGDLVLMTRGEVPNALRLGYMVSGEMVYAEGTLLEDATGTSSTTLKTFDGRSVSWVGGQFIRLPSEVQVSSRIAEGSPVGLEDRNV